MFIMIDNYDSFVYNLVRYLRELGEEILVFRNDKVTIDQIKELQPDGIILSPGPKSPTEAGIMLSIIDEFKGQVPILGICLGYQGIIHSFGGSIIEGEEPVHGKISAIHHDGKGIFTNLKNPLDVTRYHSLIADKTTVPEELEITAETKDGVIMGIRHRDCPICGVQFHPEAELTEQGHALLQNFIDESKAYRGRGQ